ncbi:DUF2789 family protein [Neptunomonas phycophila]|jgi:hypothetical protein|uniref:DUF2789 family protein n=1 Tax=Neptunomonas phycophila TaxID=1572645 RepID=A0AAW7XNI9_9GAMM|nr:MULTISPECIES: DUF2789 family protein [Neptunomonas]MBT3146673.1 DUF2789 domain-containing protein [Neptunomonas phycophila]MDN2658949.1 DUF2789 family protein [Neptunomonas sp. CHC150]MDO6454567.1 DUF2789 family protein [Neptunomonas phycophila]MDO6468857.1 DUF2789 family protein [Neptunomonas phycophila]MDO6782861.1 DUF2789 family protein [Neptunomonas phycophila]
MDTNLHTLPNLFLQLGLSDKPEEMESFIKSHTLSDGQKIEEAEYWTEGQAQFLKESRDLDGAWAESVDELSALLSQA